MKFYLSLFCLLLVGTNFLSTLADDESEVDLELVHLYLYTPGHRELPEKITNDSIPSYFMDLAPTIILTHGDKDSYTNESCTLIRDAYLKSPQGPNVIVFDWGYYSNSVNDTDAHKILPQFGRFIHNVVMSMVRKGQLNVDQVTLVGHGRGAQIMGIVGFNSRGTIDTIWGLDVHAIDKLGLYSVSNLLNRRSAKYVNVIHTSVNGLKYDLGTTDFYINGGLYQPGCEINDTRCAHARAYEYFAETIETNVGFYGQACASWIDAIQNICYSPRGKIMSVVNHQSHIYYIKTDKASPYACGAQKCLNP